MLKKCMLAIIFCLSLSIFLDANFKVAIPKDDFHPGNSILFIVEDSDGFEKIAGRVSLSAGKTEFFSHEITHDYKILSSISNEKHVDFIDEKADFIKKDEKFIYLYFEIDSPVNIVRAIVIANTLLADNPFNIVEFATDLSADEEDFFENSDNELSSFNLEDIQTNVSAELSFYNKTVLALYALWAVKSAQIKQTYKNVTVWLMSRYA